VLGGSIIFSLKGPGGGMIELPGLPSSRQPRPQSELAGLKNLKVCDMEACLSK
jgi:hypothetical protein